MITPLHIEVASALIDVEAALRDLQLWSSQSPSPEALASTQPFCVDTLTFPEWLQYVFIIRLRLMVDAGHELPRDCNVAPMVEEYFRGQPGDYGQLFKALTLLDNLLTRKD